MSWDIDDLLGPHDPDDETRHEEFVARIRAYGRDDDRVDPAYDAREAYEPDNPKHPDFYEAHVAAWDNRDKAGGL